MFVKSRFFWGVFFGFRVTGCFSFYTSLIFLGYDRFFERLIGIIVN